MNDDDIDKTFRAYTRAKLAVALAAAAAALAVGLVLLAYLGR